MSPTRGRGWRTSPPISVGEHKKTGTSTASAPRRRAPGGAPGAAAGRCLPRRHEAALPGLGAIEQNTRAGRGGAGRGGAHPRGGMQDAAQRQRSPRSISRPARWLPTCQWPCLRGRFQIPAWASEPAAPRPARPAAALGLRAMGRAQATPRRWSWSTRATGRLQRTPTLPASRFNSTFFFFFYTSGPHPLSRERPHHDSKFYTKSSPPRLKMVTLYNNTHWGALTTTR